MITYVTQIYYPNTNQVGVVMGVYSEWNKAVRSVMHPNQQEYISKTKLNDYTWRLHVCGDLFVDIIKCGIDKRVSE